MATTIPEAREWTGIQQFPVATQTALHTILGKLRQRNVDSLTVLVVGKGGVGKSSTVNSLVGERVAVVSAFQVMYLLNATCFSIHILMCILLLLLFVFILFYFIWC